MFKKSKRRKLEEDTSGKESGEKNPREESLEKNPFDSLARELQIMPFLWLIDDLNNAALVCHLFHSLARDNSIWRERVLKDFPYSYKNREENTQEEKGKEGSLPAQYYFNLYRELYIGEIKKIDNYKSSNYSSGQSENFFENMGFDDVPSDYSFNITESDVLGFPDSYDRGQKKGFSKDMVLTGNALIWNAEDPLFQQYQNQEKYEQEVTIPFFENACNTSPDILALILKNYRNKNLLQLVIEHNYLITFIGSLGFVEGVKPEHLAVVRVLVEYGADVNKFESTRQSCLYFAVDPQPSGMNEPNRALIETLIELGADPDVQCCDFFSFDKTPRSPREFCEQHPDTHGWILELFKKPNNAPELESRTTEPKLSM